ncbi:3-dehydroquinate synthase [bacterium]|nr:3-dehydroquinate synthase [bacterium]
MKTIQVTLPQSVYTYKVRIGLDILEEALSDILAQYSEPKVFIVTNETIYNLYKNHLEKQIPKQLDFEILVLPDGEQYKNLGTISQVYDFLVENKANRKSIMIAFGGGVIGDMVGFAAATYLRGISYIQIPTTLLSQVDSGIGGKTGINHPSGKNYIGSFKQPLQTIIDVSFLKTLKEREFVAGYSELIKHGLIRDPYLFQILSKTTMENLRSNNDLLIEAIFRSCEVKTRVVEQDERESGLRAILNFGHTIGHFLETFTAYKQMLHGEAVIIGMDFAAWWSYHHGYLDQDDYQLVHQHLVSLGVEQIIPGINKSKFIEIIDRDKKAASAGIKFIGITTIGKVTIFDNTSAESLWDDYQEFLKTDTFLNVI